jgi:hypothetical protein
MNKVDLGGRCAVITGGAQGIGRALAERVFSFRGSALAFCGPLGLHRSGTLFRTRISGGCISAVIEPLMRFVFWRSAKSCFPKTKPRTSYWLGSTYSRDSTTREFGPPKLKRPQYTAFPLRVLLLIVSGRCCRCRRQRLVNAALYSHDAAAARRQPVVCGVASDGAVVDWKRPRVVDTPARLGKAMRIVSLKRLTWAFVLEIVTTVLTPQPSTIVVAAPEPITLKLKPMVRFSV